MNCICSHPKTVHGFSRLLNSPHSFYFFCLGGHKCTCKEFKED